MALSEGSPEELTAAEIFCVVALPAGLVAAASFARADCVDPKLSERKVATASNLLLGHFDFETEAPAAVEEETGARVAGSDSRHSFVFPCVCCLHFRSCLHAKLRVDRAWIFLIPTPRLFP